MDAERFTNEMHISQSPSKCSVVLNNVFKTHNNEIVFNGLNLVAHSSQICAILGGIKTGKSMLLSCIVGGEKIDKGHIWVLGGKPRTKNSRTLSKFVGYMPQDFCLYDTLTILELLTYFGQLYVLNCQFILWQISYYSNIFTIPQSNVNISDLSFSEKRMISFIIAVFHRPRLLILDEPTVGIDIFKKHQIWKYLNDSIMTWKPTVIVATNNIEEAFSATKIAYLKNGKIIFNEKVEKIQRMSPPNKSIDIIIEDLYTSIISNLQENAWINSNQTETPSDKKLSFYQKIKPRSNIWRLKTIIAQNLKFLTKNIWMFILLCIIPTLQVILHCIYYGNYPDPLPMAVYNEETDCFYNPCRYIGNCTYVSCDLLKMFDANKLQVKYYCSETVARYSVTKGLTAGFIKVPKNYTIALIDSITQSSSNKHDALSKYGVYVEVDMSKFEFGCYIRKNLINAHKSHLINVYTHYNLSKIYADIPFKSYEFNNLDLTENTAPQIISCAIFSSAMFYSALILQSEISNGYLMRNLIAGVTFFEFIMSIICIQIILSTIQGFCLILLADFFLYIRWQSSLLLIVILNITVGINGMSIGLFIGSLAKSVHQVFQLSLIIYILNLIMSGIYWPLDNIIFLPKSFVAILPLSMSIRAVNAVSIKGRQLYTEEISHALLSIICWTLISFIGLFFKLKKYIYFII